MKHRLDKEMEYVKEKLKDTKCTEIQHTGVPIKETERMGERSYLRRYG